jgi:fibronectin-binding autotransporter adhesin
MKIMKTLTLTLLSITLLAIGLLNGQAQTLATWTGASGGSWNVDGNWNTGLVPGVGTNVFITTNYIVNYSSAMTAASVGAITNQGGTLNISAAGFNVDGSGTTTPAIGLAVGGTINIKSGVVVTITNSGGIYMNTNAMLTVDNATLIFTNTLGGYDMLVGQGKRNNGAIVGLTNSTTVFSKGLVVASGNSSGVLAGSVYMLNGTLVTPSLVVSNSNDDTTTRFMMDGTAKVEAGNILVHRCSPFYGVILSNGVMNASSIVIGYYNSRSGMNVINGTLTNSGAFTLYNISNDGSGGDRKAYFYQRGGKVVSTSSSGLVLGNAAGSSATATGIANQGAVYDISGGTLMAENIVMCASDTLLDLTARVNLSGTGTIYVGSGGITANIGDSSVVTIISCTNGTWGASADWACSRNMWINSGTTTFKAANEADAPYNITLSGVLSGNGNLNKTGGGTLTLNALNTGRGDLLINAGNVALGSSGSVSNQNIIVGSGTTFDVSSASSYTVNAAQNLCGSGSVNGTVTVAAEGTIKPGSNALTGTLKFANNVVESGSAHNHFHLSDNPAGPDNDLVIVTNTLTASGTNYIDIVGSLTNNGVYKLIQYGTFTGDITNFTLTGAAGRLTNIVADNTIYLVALGGSRGPTNVTWLGNPVTNVWDIMDATNWSISGTGSPTNFIPGDNARFDSIGAAYPLVDIVGTVTPASVIVDTTSNYTFYSSIGTGAIGGTGGLTKTNAGTLTILATNNYTGPTVIAGGVIEVPGLANGGANSPIGGASTDPGNLVLTNGTLRYLGNSASTDRGATFTANSSGILEVTNPATTLTMSGTMTGPGVLVKSGPGTVILSSENYYGSTVVSNGILQVNSVFTAIGSGPISFAGGTVRFNVSSQQIYSNALNIVSAGTIVSAGGNNNVVTGPWSGSSTLTVDMSGGGTFTIAGDITTNFTGTILLTDTSLGTFRFNSGGSDPCTGSTNVLFDLGNSTVTFLNRNGNVYGTTNYYLGALSGGSGTILSSSTSSGRPNTYQIGDKGLSTTFSGTIVNGASIISITKAGTGTLTLAGVNTYTGATIISNGVLALSYNPTNSSDGTISSSSNIVINSGAYLDVTGRTDGKLPLGSSQVLRGNGTILGGLDTTSGSMVSPGASIGTLTVTNNIVLGGTAWMELNRASSPNSDRLVSSLSSITYGGTLVVTNIGDALQPNDTFTLFSGSSLNAASFGTVILPNYYIWNTNLLTINGSISVTAVSPPAISTVDFSGLAGGSITINATNGAANGTVIVLTSTNLTLPLSSWTPVVTNSFDGSGNLTGLSVTVDPAAPEQFYTLKAY